MISRSFAAFILSAIILVPLSAFSGGRAPKSQEETAARDELISARRIKAMSPAIPPLLGPHASQLRHVVRSSELCNESGHPMTHGAFTCSQYTSGLDNSRWKFATRRDEQRMSIIHVFRLRNNTWIEHATIHGDMVTSSSPEARMYAAGQYDNAPGHAANDQNSGDRALKELGRALGTAIPGKGQQPLRLPPIFGR